MLTIAPAARRGRLSRSRPMRLSTMAVATSALAGSTLVGLMSFSNPAVAAAPISLWSASTTPRVVADPDTASTTLGVKFTSTQSGQVSAIRFYKSALNVGPFKVSLWTSTGSLLRTASLSSTTTGWQNAPLSSPVTITAGRTYVASYVAPKGRYAGDVNNLSPTMPKVTGPLRATQGVYSYTGGMPTKTWNSSNYYVDIAFTPTPAPTTTSTTTPTATATPSPTATATTTTTTTTTATPTPSTTTPPPPSSGAFPNASNTGVPDGVVLTTYTGPLTITTAGTVINGKRINGDLIIKAANVSVTNSHLNGRLLSNTTGASVAVTDSFIDGGNQETFPTVSYQNITLKRVEAVGGQHTVQCHSNCTVLDSWLHGQYHPTTSAGHVNAFISNGGSGFVLRHNTLHCTALPSTTVNGGCTADASLFGDFGPISDATFDNNLFKARSDGAGYCLAAGYNPGKPYGSNPTRVLITNNVFERGTNNKCGIYGPVAAFLNANGNQFTGNTWNDGTALNL